MSPLFNFSKISDVLAVILTVPSNNPSIASLTNYEFVLFFIPIKNPTELYSIKLGII